MANKILIVDDDEKIIEEWRKQADASIDWRDKTFLICYGRDDVFDVLQQHASDITAVFLDFDLLKDSQSFGAEKFMKATKDYLDWDKVRCFWFSGDEELKPDKIKPAKAKFSRLDTAHIRKPCTFLQLIARLIEKDTIPYWQNFPWPLRVINHQAQVVYSNEHWNIPVNDPAPELFIKKDKSFNTGERDFYGRHPDGDTKKYLEFNHFRLISTASENNDYLLQFAQGLAGLEKTQERNNLEKLIEKITIALKGHGFKRVRLYRYYSIPSYYEETQNNKQNTTGFMPLYYTNTALRHHQAGIQKKRQECDCCTTKNRADWINKKINDIDKESKTLIYKIDDEANPKNECDINTIPEKSKNTQFVLELPLITSKLDISKITQEKLLGLLVIDYYDESNNSYTEITDDDVQRLQHTLLSYCRALTYSLELDIENKDKQTKIDYANFDKDFLNDLDNTDKLLEALLEKAIKATKASVGYITEPYSIDSYKITVVTDHDLFQGYVFSDQATDLPVVRCWKAGKNIALPNLKKQKYIIEKIVKTYSDKTMVWHSDTDKIIPNSQEIRGYLETKIASLIALPVSTGNERIAAIILHAEEPYHFDYEKLNCLEYLITRVGLALMVARKIKQRQLFLDGVVHEIKSDLIPLKQALNSLQVDDTQQTVYLRAQYCATRLDMASKNLLLMTRDTAFDLTKISCLFDVLTQIKALYEEEMHDKTITLCFKPELDNPIWATPILMSIEWLTHIIANLLDNAVKYTKRDTITVSAEIDHKQLKLHIINSGHINQDELATIFEPEYRSKQGTGFHVGLSSCKRVMQEHNGDIVVENIAENTKIQIAVTWQLANTKEK